MKTSPYSPDKFMASLYEKSKATPYANVSSADDVLEIGAQIREKTKELLAVERISCGGYRIEKVGKAIEYPDYTIQKYSFELCENLKTAVFILTPKKIKESAPGVVALCGHGYGVRQILGITKSGKKKRIRYIDNYQKNFAVELVKRGCIVAAPELFGFGEARLKKDLIKPFYISSCDELSHHLLPCGLTTACVRVAQAIACTDILISSTPTNPEKLGIMGISGGGLTALYASVIDERFSKTVISGYINTFRGSIFSMWHCPDNYIPDILRIGDIYDFASSLAPRKLLIESGTKDKLFPIETSREAHKQISKIYSLAGAENNLTVDVFDGKHSVSGRKSFDFLAE